MGSSHSWVLFAFGSAFFAALTAVLGKLGVADVNSNLATLIRTIVILAMICGIVLWRQEWQGIAKVPAYDLAMLALSGIATGLSWLCYYRALQLGPASRVAPVDKLSVALVIVFSVIFLGESLSWKTALGGLLVTGGAVLLAF